MSLHQCLTVILAGVCALALSPVEADSVIIEAGADNTLYQDPEDVSNGAGSFMLAGRTNSEEYSVRRALLYFDVAGNLPPGAVVEDVFLSLYLERGNGGERTLHLHRLVSDWGEGESAVEGGGLGAPAEEGDATWQHTFHPDRFWGRDGARYSGRVSASQVVGVTGDNVDPPDFYVWESTDRLVQDVRRWLRQPEGNFGWLLIGDETERQTIKRFASRDNADSALRPVLEIEYHVDP